MAHLLTTVVIPCYNEADRFHPESFLRMVRSSTGVKLLFVNDGSRDATLEILEATAQKAPEKISVLHCELNGGKAEAVRRGVLQAISAGSSAVGYWDADLATPLRDIFSFREVLERRADVHCVIGSRLPLLGRDIQRHPLRRLLGRSFAFVASQALGIPIVDTQCGAKLFRVLPETCELFSRPFLSRWIFDVELLARWINRTNDRRAVAQKLFEFPLENWEDVPGSKLRPHHFLLASREILQIHSRYLAPWSKPWEPAPVQLPASKESNEILPRRAA